MCPRNSLGDIGTCGMSGAKQKLEQWRVPGILQEFEIAQETCYRTSQRACLCIYRGAHQFPDLSPTPRQRTCLAEFLVYTGSANFDLQTPSSDVQPTPHLSRQGFAIVGASAPPPRQEIESKCRVLRMPQFFRGLPIPLESRRGRGTEHLAARANHHQDWSETHWHRNSTTSIFLLLCLSFKFSSSAQRSGSCSTNISLSKGFSPMLIARSTDPLTNCRMSPCSSGDKSTRPVPRKGVDIPELEWLPPKRCRICVQVAFEYGELFLRPRPSECRWWLGYPVIHCAVAVQVCHLSAIHAARAAPTRCSRLVLSKGAMAARFSQGIASPQLVPAPRRGGGGPRSSGSQDPCPRARSGAPVPPPAPAAHPWLSTRRRVGFARPERAGSLLLTGVRVEILLQLRQQEEYLFHRICYQQDVGHIELG